MLRLSRGTVTAVQLRLVRSQWRHRFSAVLLSSRSISEWRKRFGDEGERILNIVSRRVQERDQLVQQLSENAHLPEQIQRAKLVKELEPLSEAWQEWKLAEKSYEDLKPLLEDPDADIRAMAKEDEPVLAAKLQSLVKDTFPTLLMPSSPTAHYTALVEIKSGVGGEESALFAAEMLRLYTRFAALQGWQCEIVSQSTDDRGGVREAILEVKGDGSYDAMRWENGVHRVQRVPQTESQGRVHTSTISVMVLPKAPSTPGQETVEEDVVDEKDVRVDVMRARGAGGQHVNRTESAVRLVHEPTGITVSMQDSRSQHQNKARAWEILRARLLERKLAEDAEKRRSMRKSLIKSADRSEKVRTYNFPQDRVTDHRIGMTLKNLELFMEGERLQNVHEALAKDAKAAELEELLASAVTKE